MAPSTHTNPPNANLNITAHATDWLWAVFAVMVVSDLIALFWAYRRPVGQRFFHHLPVIILTVSAIAYFSMASDLGSTPIATEFTRGRAPGTTRQIWYVRYIQWFINAPLILLLLFLISGFALSDIFATIFMAEVIIVSGLLGALVRTSYKWGYYVFGVFAYLYVASSLLWHAPRTNFNAGGTIRGSFVKMGGYVAFIWMLYLICWPLSEAGNVISPTSEMIFYGILDLLAGPIFLFLFLASIRNTEYAAFGLQGTRTGAYSGRGGGAGMSEKGANPAQNRMSNVTNGTDNTAPGATVA